MRYPIIYYFGLKIICLDEIKKEVKTNNVKRE